MRILISGASGFIGRSLLSYFSKKNWELVPLQHETDLFGKIHWWIQGGSLENFDAVIHLAGEPIVTGRWSEEKKQKILSSRSHGTLALSQALAKIRRPPSIFISASAVGYYGSRGEELLDEASAPGKGFLAHVCREWEEGSQPIDSRSTRTVRARFGMVLGSGGGALAKMTPFYRFGLGGKLGSGDQWVSWITITDLTLALDHILRTEALHGPVNVVTPYPVRQKEFNRILGQILHRSAFFHLPRWLLRLRFGMFADEVLLPSARVQPKKLIQSGFHFKYPNLEEALYAIYD